MLQAWAAAANTAAGASTSGSGISPSGSTQGVGLYGLTQEAIRDCRFRPAAEVTAELGRGWEHRLCATAAFSALALILGGIIDEVTHTHSSHISAPLLGESGMSPALSVTYTGGDDVHHI